MSPCNLLGACTLFLAIFAAGCGRPAGEASRATLNGLPAAEIAVEKSTTPPAEDDAWRGLERHEIELDQKLLVVKGSKGVIGCPYLNVGSFEKLGEACAIIPAVDTAGMQPMSHPLDATLRLREDRVSEADRHQLVEVGRLGASYSQ